MNIFWLDTKIEENVKMYVDKHVVKMITEYVQLLNTAYYFTGEYDKACYKCSHYNHPCSIWIRQSLSNWRYLNILAKYLYVEYKYRYGHYKKHRAGEYLFKLEEPNLKDIGMTVPPQCMPEDCKCEYFIQAYRNYYNKYKRHIFSWTYRDIPEWIILDNEIEE